MAGDQNLELARQGYAAFGSGDVAAAMENLADDIEWIVPGNSAVSGTLRGKQQVGEYWGRLAEKNFAISPQYWFADDERVVVLSHVTLEGGEADAADVLTFSDGKVVRFQSAFDTALLERIFGSE